MKKIVKITSLLLIICLLFTVTGCSIAKETKSDNLSLAIGLMPAVDAAPMLLAEKKGYFKDLGLNVTLEIYTNAQNRQSALQSQSIDGAMTDLIAVATNVNGGFDIKATTMTNGSFPVLSKVGIEGKKDIKVGMMEVSVSNFLIDEWLGGGYNIEKVFINDIPARLAAIGSGQLDMGIFPEPVASMGALSGLKKNIFDTDGDCPDVLVFTGKALKEKAKAIELFHQGYNKAIEDLIKNPQEARDILIEKIPNVKPEVKDMIVLPTYTKASLPSDEYINKVIRWTTEVVKKDLNVKVEDLVERKFVK